MGIRRKKKRKPQPKRITRADVKKALVPPAQGIIEIETIDALNEAWPNIEGKSLQIKTSNPEVKEEVKKIMKRKAQNV